MASEIEPATGLLDLLVKILYGFFAASLGWVWRTERSHNTLKQRQQDAERRLGEIEKLAEDRSNKFNDLATDVSEMRGELKGVAKGIDTIQEWIMHKAK